MHISFSLSLLSLSLSLNVLQHVFDWLLAEARAGERRKVLCIPSGEEGAIRTALEAYGAIAASAVSCGPLPQLAPRLLSSKMSATGFSFHLLLVRFRVCDFSHVRNLFWVRNCVHVSGQVSLEKLRQGGWKAKFHNSSQARAALDASALPNLSWA